MNNIVEFEARANVERQAREWLVRMDRDEPLTDSEIQSVREWMRRSPFHAEELKRICEFWRGANVLTELSVGLTSAAYSIDQQPVEKRQSWVPALGMAATAAIAAVALTWWYFQRMDGMINGSYHTAVGQQKSIALADGSSIQMNTDSQVQVAYSGEQRSIHLLKGEALFSVMPDPRRPFEVYAAESIVRAVGTAFAVHLDGTKIDVTVTKGAVDVAEAPPPAVLKTSHSKSIKSNAPSSSSLGRLKAGEMTEVDSGTDHIDIHRLPDSELQRKMAWQEGYLAFSGQSLSEVVAQVNRYSEVTLEIDDPQLASVAIGGRFKIGDLDAVLDVLETNFGIHAQRTDNHVIRLQRR